MLRPRLAALATLCLALCILASPAVAQDVNARKIIHEDRYRPTPGDVYSLTINYGVNPSIGSAQRTETIELVLQADYGLIVPYIGEVDARNLTYAQLQDTVATRVRDRLLVPYASLSLTSPAVYDVFIWGSVAQPGYHTITSLNRLSEALGIAGGVAATGTRRRVEVQSGDRARNFDLVAFLAEGEEDQNPYIRPGDRVFVPVAESAVELRGAFVVPGTYELLGNESIGDLIDLAGGLLPTAQPGRATVNRLNESNRYTLEDIGDVDLASMEARTGDIVTIPASTSTSETILVEGAVHEQPAQEGSPRAVPLEPILIEVPYTPGLTVLRLLEQFGGPTNFAEPERSFIIRGEDRRREPVPDLGTLWSERQWDRDIALEPGDRLVVPMKRLVVAVGGSVNDPGGFPFTSGYAVGDYIELAGGIDEENGSPNQLFFAEPDGTLTRVDVDTPVPIGANIYVGRSGWGQAKKTFGDIFTVTGWVTGIMGVTTAVINFIRIFSPDFL